MKIISLHHLRALYKIMLQFNELINQNTLFNNISFMAHMFI
jgi:hypothetical protein